MPPPQFKVALCLPFRPQSPSPSLPRLIRQVQRRLPILQYPTRLASSWRLAQAALPPIRQHRPFRLTSGFLERASDSDILMHISTWENIDNFES